MASVLRRLPLLLVVVWSVGSLSLINAQVVDGCVEGEVRLVGGGHYREGNVEVCRRQQWGRVCDDEWDEDDSAVVCRQLGLASEGVMAFTASGGNPFTGNDALPFLFDDLGCSGSERNLLECLPDHNCGPIENAGVRCQRKGVTLEHDQQRLMNNSIVTLNEIGETSEALICATDSRTCCTAESEDDGNWYSPNGSKIGPQIDNSTLALYVSRNNHTVGLNYVNVSDIPSGIYRCEIADNNNVANHLYVGIYPQEQGMARVTSLNYDSTTNTLVCTSTGGPVTTVTWSKDDNSGITNEQYYEQSMAIIDTTTATYQSRLRILNKSSESTGHYTCTVSNSRGRSNQTIHLEVCRDMELRFSDQGSGNVEVCIGDQWHAVTNGAIVNNNTQGNIAVIARNPTSVMIRYTSNSARVQAYDASCTTVSNGQIHSTKVAAVSRDVTEIQINGLAPNTNYECCATAYMMTNVPIDTISLSCTTTNTPPSVDLPPVQTPATSEVNNNLFRIGFWTILGICALVLVVFGGFIVGCLVALKQQTKSMKYSIGSSEKEYSERMVLNPIYTDSGSFGGSSDFRDRNLSLSVAQNPQYGTRAEVVPVTYETITDFPTRPKAGAHSRGNSSRRDNSSQPGDNELNGNGLGNSVASLDSVDGKTDATAPQLYSTIPESYKRQELGSKEEIQKHPLVNNTYEDH